MMDTTLLISAQTIECNIAGVFNQFRSIDSICTWRFLRCTLPNQIHFRSFSRL